MIEAGSGDLLDADVEALVNTVNTVGVMGKGLALQFKRRFPANFAAYAAACKRGEVEIGRMLVVETKEPTGPRYIINFPTKKHWRSPSKIAPAWWCSTPWRERARRSPSVAARASPPSHSRWRRAGTSNASRW